MQIQGLNWPYFIVGVWQPLRLSHARIPELRRAFLDAGCHRSRLAVGHVAFAGYAAGGTILQKLLHGWEHRAAEGHLHGFLL